MSGRMRIFAPLFRQSGRLRHGSRAGSEIIKIKSFMKKIVEILGAPRRGGQIVVPRRLLEKMFRDTNVFTEAEACVYILANCAFSAGQGGTKLRRGEMCVTQRCLADRFNWSQSRLRRFLQVLKDNGLFTLEAKEKAGTVLRYLHYDQACTLGYVSVKTIRMWQSEADEKVEAAFSEFWKLYHQRSGLVPRDMFLARQLWYRMPEEERQMALDRMEWYFMSLPDMGFVRSGLNYLKCKSYFG